MLPLTVGSETVVLRLQSAGLETIHTHVHIADAAVTRHWGSYGALLHTNLVKKCPGDCSTGAVLATEQELESQRSLHLVRQELQAGLKGLFDPLPLAQAFAANAGNSTFAGVLNQCGLKLRDEAGV